MMNTPMDKHSDFLNCLRVIKNILDLDIWLRDAEGRYLLGVRNTEELIDKGEVFIVEKCLAQSFTGPIVFNGIHNLLIGRTMQHIEKTVYGSFKILETEIIDVSGNLIAVFGYSKDITQEVLLSNFPGFAYRSKDDHDYSMTFLSEGCYQLTGYKSEDLLNKTPSYYQLIEPNSRKDLLEMWRDDLGPSEIGSVEYPITTAGGESKWVWELYQERRNPNQLYIATEGFVTDITDKKVTENALIRSEERLRTLFEKAPMGMGIFDSKSGVPDQINNKFAEILGMDKEKVLTMSWTQYTHPDDIESNLNNLDTLVYSKDEGFSMVKRFIKEDGAIIWVNMTIAPFMFEKGSNPRHLCMIEDITSRKKAEEEILFLSYHDILTGLYNRRYYEQVMLSLDTSSNLPMSMIVADVNGLKLINDAFGHMAGDELLKKFADTIKKALRPGDVAARIGGDEFVILLPKTNFHEAEKIIDKFNREISYEKVNCVTCSVSFGLSTKFNVEEDINSIFRQAEDHMYKNKLHESTSMRNETIRVITKALHEKSKNEQAHCERVSKFCGEMGKALGMNASEINELITAGLLHDIGKIGVDLCLLNKSENLTDKEWVEVRQHPEIGYQILKSVSEFASIAEYVLYHHERIDGTGYPRGIKGVEIPWQSRIICIVNAYDRMTNYNKEMNELEAIEELRRNAGTQFDRTLVEVFVKKILEAQATL